MRETAPEGCYPDDRLTTVLGRLMIQCGFCYLIAKKVTKEISAKLLYN